MSMQGFSPRHSQSGFTLIEVLISAVIGIVLLMGVLTVFDVTNATRARLQRQSELSENGRFALNLIQGNLKLAGFYGEYNPVGLATPTTVPNVCSTTVADWQAALPLAVQGFPGGSGAPSCIPAVVTNSDVLVIRRSSTCLAGVGNCEATVANAPYFQTSGCSTDASAYQLSTDATTLTLHNRNCTTVAGLRRFVTDIYYLSPNNVTGDGVPTLKRLELTGGATDCSSSPCFKSSTLAAGVEMFRVEYGLDTTGADGLADTYTRDVATYGGCAAQACAAANWRNVVSTRISMLSRSLNAEPNYTNSNTYSVGGLSVTAADSYKRQMYSEVVRLVNPSSRKETP